MKLFELFFVLVVLVEAAQHQHVSLGQPDLIRLEASQVAVGVLGNLLVGRVAEDAWSRGLRGEELLDQAVLAVLDLLRQTLGLLVLRHRRGGARGVHQHALLPLPGRHQSFLDGSRLDGGAARWSPRCCCRGGRLAPLVGRHLDASASALCPRAEPRLLLKSQHPV